MCAQRSWLVLNPSLEEHILNIQKAFGISDPIDLLGLIDVCPTLASMLVELVQVGRNPNAASALAYAASHAAARGS